MGQRLSGISTLLTSKNKKKMSRWPLTIVMYRSLETFVDAICAICYSFDVTFPLRSCVFKLWNLVGGTIMRGSEIFYM